MGIRATCELISLMSSGERLSGRRLFSKVWFLMKSLVRPSMISLTSLASILSSCFSTMALITGDNLRVFLVKTFNKVF